jgi:hypothetical protein
MDQSCCPSERRQSEFTLIYVGEYALWISVPVALLTGIMLNVKECSALDCLDSELSVIKQQFRPQETLAGPAALA